MPSVQKETQYIVGGYILTDQPAMPGFGNCNWFGTNIKFNTRPEALAWMKEKRFFYKKHGKQPVFSLRKETVEYWGKLK